MKELVGILAAALAFVAYAPYVSDILKGKTKPHPYSWFIWGFLTAVIFALQITHGGGAGAYVTFTVALLSFVIFFLALKECMKEIKLIDTFFFIAAFVATGLWLIAKQPVISIILLVTIDMLGFAPTIRKAWNKPHEETLLTWGINGFRHALSIFAIREYNLITLLNPVAWAVANGLFSILLIIRRKIINGVH